MALVGGVVRWAQIGDEGRCVRCGLLVSFEPAGDGYRWRAVRRTKRAPDPLVCPSHNTGGPHRTGTHSATGEPLPPPRA